MANPLFSSIPLPPLTIESLHDSTNVFALPEYTLQLQVDTLNVLENRVPITDFTPERQAQIEAYYQFSGDLHNVEIPKTFKRTIDTLDLI